MTIKKMFTLFICFAMALGITACTAATPADTAVPAATDSGEATSETTETADGVKDALIGFCALDTSNSFVAGLAEDTKKLLEADGATVQIADAALDSSKQISQIENFAVMGAKVIIIIPVDPDSLTDSIKYAQSLGTKVLVMNADTHAYDCFMTSDRYEIGKQCAQLAADWIDETFPDAADRSIEVAIFESRSNPQESEDSDGMHEIENLCSKATISKVVDGIATNEAAQEAIATLLQTNPEVKVVICFNGEGCLGVNEYAMTSGLVSIPEFATFGGDWSNQIAEEVYKSLSNESVYRGSVKFGSDNIPLSAYEITLKMINGEPYDAIQYDPIIAVNSKNINEYYKAN